MQAVRVGRFRGFPDLAWSAVPRPTPDVHEALVRVLAVALSRSDLDALSERTTPGLEPLIPGTSIAGEVAMGSRFPVGTRVLIDPYLPCGSCRACAVGEGCHTPDVIGRHAPGGLAEFVVCPVDRLVPLPRILSVEDGAAFAAAGAIAGKVVFDDLHLRSGERLLLTGSTGSLGLSIILLARAAGADVMALVNRHDRSLLAIKAGAHAAIPVEVDGRLFAPEDLGGGVDTVVHLGRDSRDIERLVACLRSGGRVLVRRIRAGERLYLDLGSIATNGLRVVGSVGAASSGLAKAVATLASSPHSVVVDDVLPAEQLATGFERLAARENRGAVVVRPPG